MFSTNILRLYCGIAMLLLAYTSHSQQEEIEKYYEDWYQIEVIIVANKSQIPNKDPERWPKNLALSYPLQLQFLTDPEELRAIEEQKNDLQSPLTEDVILSGSDDSESTNALPSLEEEQAPLDESIDIGYDFEEPFMLLDVSNKNLVNELNSLLRTGAYRELFHEVWRQPIKNKLSAPSIVIFGGNTHDKNNELEGAIEISLSRYLHLSTNLWFTQFEPNFGQADYHWPNLPQQPVNPLLQIDSEDEPPYLDRFSDTKTDWFTPADEEENKFSIDSSSLQLSNEQFQETRESSYLIKQIATLNSKRRMRSGELHYIDHPQIGLLIRIDKYVPEILEIENQDF